MAQANAMKRQTLIIKLLQRGGKNFKEIKKFLEIESEIQSVDLYISQRTFQRDIRNIRDFYGIEIIYNRTNKNYEIYSDNIDTKTERLLDAFVLYNTLNITDKISKYIQFENRKQGGEHFIMDIITAIKNRNIIYVHYKKYWEEDFTLRVLEPLTVKEYRYRWYLVAKDKKDKHIKTFGLDRIYKIVQKDEKYKYPDDFNAEKYFKDCYGVINPDDIKVENIELSFTAFQGRYIKSLPLHHSQKLLIDNENEYRISLKLKPTLDFIMDLQYYGECLKVIKPKWLADEIKSILKKALGQY